VALRAARGRAELTRCYTRRVANRTEPKTAGEWIRYIVMAVIALYLVWWLLRSYVLWRWVPPIRVRKVLP